MLLIEYYCILNNLVLLIAQIRKPEEEQAEQVWNGISERAYGDDVAEQAKKD